MAYLDQTSGQLVLRIVYDGAPLSGKTTTLRALGAMFKREVSSPGEAEGRTLWFDWMEYVGGTFGGLPISCHVVSVPGQDALRDRRRRLLVDADAVVYVFDTAPDRFAGGMDHLRRSRDWLRELEGPPVGLVVQANKSDLEQAVPPADIKTAIADPTTAVVRASATEKTGVREAYVLGVRLAIDRAHALAERGELRHRTALDADADSLLTRMSAAETDPRSVTRPPPTATPSTPDSLTRHEREGDVRWLPLALRQLLPLIEPLAAVHPWTRRLHERSVRAAPPDRSQKRAPPTLPQRAPAEVPAARADPSRDPSASKQEAQIDDIPGFPDEDVPGGCIWPPVRGRIHLRSAVAEGVATIDLAPAIWRGETSSGWHFVQPRHLVFDDAFAGRRALVEAARHRTRLCELLSRDRCLVLAEGAKPSGWRLWEFARDEVSLRDEIVAAVDNGDEAELARTLLGCARRWTTAWRSFEALGRQDWLSKLDQISVDGDRLVFGGLVDDAEPAAPPTYAPEQRARCFRDAFESVIKARIAHLSVPKLITAIEREAADDPLALPLATPLVAMAIGH